MIKWFKWENLLWKWRPIEKAVNTRLQPNSSGSLTAITIMNTGFNYTLKGLQLIWNSIDDVTHVYIQTALCWKNTVRVMFRRAKRRVVMVRLHTLSSRLPKHKGFARQYARESCYGFWVTLEVTSSILQSHFSAFRNRCQIDTLIV